MIKNLRPVWITFFYVFWCNIIKFNNFLYCFSTLLNLMSSSLHTISLLVPNAYLSTESIDWLLLWFEPKAISLISSVKPLWFSLLNLCSLFNISLLLFMNYLLFFLKIIHIKIIFFSVVYFVYFFVFIIVVC